jgi:enamine deaminase RidA (YjgF/YER057c/UK114 family)
MAGSRANAEAQNSGIFSTIRKAIKSAGKAVDDVVSTTPASEDTPFPYSGAGDAKRKRDIEEATK